MITFNTYKRNSRRVKFTDLTTPRKYWTPTKSGRRWKPYDHAEIIQAVASEFAAREVHLKQGRYYLYRLGGQSLACSFVVQGLSNEVKEALDGEYEPTVNILNPNARREHLCIFPGLVHTKSGIGILFDQYKYSNSAILSCEYVAEDFTERYFDWYYHEIEETCLELRKCRVFQREREEVLMLAGRKEIMPWSRIGRVEARFQPDDKEDHSRLNAWDLLLAFGAEVQRNTTKEQLRQLYEFYAMLDFYLFKKIRKTVYIVNPPHLYV